MVAGNLIGYGSRRDEALPTKIDSEVGNVPLSFEQDKSLVDSYMRLCGVRMIVLQRQAVRELTDMMTSYHYSRGKMSSDLSCIGHVRKNSFKRLTSDRTICGDLTGMLVGLKFCLLSLASHPTHHG